MKTRSNADWLDALKSSGDAQAAALAELRAYLLRAALYALHRHRSNIGHLRPTEIVHLAEDCAQEALMALLSHLHTFRGESRFTTWAYSFAVNTALVAARRERWKRVPLDEALHDPDLSELPASEVAAPDPERRARNVQMLALVREAIEQQLTPRQRQALNAIVMEGVPLDEVVRHWGSNRNAVYKLLHDARRKLKAHLEARGFTAAEVLDLTGGER
jgi:RNA polymerase sigma-70 factor, ECF subfamily